MIGIIDYGMGNLRSVQKALEKVGAQAHVVAQPEQLTACHKLVLPGVGAFADGMKHLHERSLTEPLKDFARSGKPLLGICLGMQLFFESSQEDAPSPEKPIPGLGLLPGQVVAFTGSQFGPGKLKIPHMGWNALLDVTCNCPIFANIQTGEAVYFVHGYYAKPSDASIVAASADHGGKFCAAAWQDNISATQFHPEKSQAVGLKMLKAFVAM